MLFPDAVVGASDTNATSGEVTEEMEIMMQMMTRFSRMARTIVATGALMAALAAGSVSASTNDVGYTECDHGCVVSTAGEIGSAAFQDISSIPVGTVDSYVSHAPGQIGFTR